MKAVARAIAVTIGCVLVATACSGGSSGNSRAAPSNAGTAQTLLVVGTGNALGDTLDDPLRDDWPRVVYLDAFPRATVFVNAAERDATVASALSRQVPIAQELMPETVLVWVGVNDMDRGVSPTTFEASMTALLRALKPTSATPRPRRRHSRARRRRPGRPRRLQRRDRDRGPDHWCRARTAQQQDLPADAGR